MLFLLSYDKLDTLIEITHPQLKKEYPMFKRYDDEPIDGQIEKLFIQDSWRVFRIISEFVEGFEELAAIGDCVTMFGSVRTKSNDKDYKKIN